MYLLSNRTLFVMTGKGLPQPATAKCAIIADHPAKDSNVTERSAPAPEHLTPAE